MILKTRPKLTILIDQLAALAFILYFSMPLLKRLLRPISFGQTNFVAIAITYLPVFLLIFLGRKKRCWMEFIVLLSSIGFFFLFTYFFHPEYEYYYVRERYGVWDYVLRPDNGIYAFLFIRLVDDPKKILKYLLICSWLMFIHLGISFFEYIARGYWITVREGTTVHSSYNLTFGYDLLLFEIIFLYFALKYKKLIHWIMAIAGGIMMLAGGSRGPFLDILIFLVVYISVSIQRSRKKLFITSSLIALLLVLYFGYTPILNVISTFLSRMGLSSRLIKMIIAGTASDDNGRAEIWARAIQMIKEKPWGYGAMGSREGIYDLIYVGHPHNVFLEILIDYGVIFGAGIILTGFVAFFRMLKMPDIGEWTALILIFIGASCQLLLSGTYWYRPWLWVLLAIGISVYHFRRRERVING